MNRLLFLLPLLLVACTAEVRTTHEYDAVALATANHWAGLFWVCVAVGVAVVGVAWAIAWCIVERSREP